MAQPDSLRRQIDGWCQDEGFPLVAVASAADLPQARSTARARLADGHLADMAWMDEAWLDRATNPETFLEGARSLIILALPNHSPDPPVEASAEGTGTRGRVARYARGRDYHRVFEKRLRRLAARIRQELGAGARATVDYGPLLERPHAALAGMGWLGKSTMLLVPGFGPWVMLGVIATTLDLPPDAPLRKSCGSCTRCLTACPTGALAADGHVLDARRCISYQTIENRGPIPRELRPLFGDWIFGCDGCLDACPVGAGRWSTWPEFAPPVADRAFPPVADILALDEEAFAARFRGTAIMRAKRAGLARNACLVAGNTGTADDVPALLRALHDISALVRGHAAWALARLVERDVAHQPDAIRAALVERLAEEQDDWVREELDLALRVPGLASLS